MCEKIVTRSMSFDGGYDILSDKGHVEQVFVTQHDLIVYLDNTYGLQTRRLILDVLKDNGTYHLFY